MNKFNERRNFITKSSALLLGAALFPQQALAQTQFKNSDPASSQLDEFIDYDATALAQLIRDKHISQAELVEVFIKRISHLNPLLNFMAVKDFDRARQRTKSIPINSPFSGVPVLTKDMIEVGGMTLANVSRLLANNKIAKNVQYIDGLENSGLNMLGSTNVPEFAGGLTTHNDLFGQTRNPWDLQYSPFISSGGSAVAVAAGIVPMAHGTDGAGSNRLPASATGVFGMKASRYRMLSGERKGNHDLVKTNQAISRSVRDSALLFDYTQDKHSKLLTPIDFLQGPAKKRLRVGFVKDAPGLLKVDSEVNIAQENTAKLLEQLGHDVVETHYPVDAKQFAKAYPLFFAERLLPLKNMIENKTGKPVTETKLLTHFLATLTEHASHFSEKDIAWGKQYFVDLRHEFQKPFEKFDVLLTPVSPLVAPKLDQFDPAWAFNAKTFNTLVGSLKFTGPVNFAGNPAMSVPLNWGKDSGLPIGSHFIGGQCMDKMLYQLAYELEMARPWKDKGAPHSAKYALA